MKLCAFLRGVNVKGTSMKMADVCRVFAGAGMQDVSAVLASGNIIFSAEGDREIIKDSLEKAMSVAFDYEAFLFIRSHSEVAKMLTDLPFPENENLHSYVFIGTDGSEAMLLDEFNKSEHAPEEKGAKVDTNFYWQVPKGNTLHSEFGKILGKKAVKQLITSRNMNTIKRISDKMK